MLSESLRIKAEAYYQHLFNVPVRSDVSNSFSIINFNDGYVIESLDNDGTGKNYGLELTVEQFLKKNYYFLLSGLLYESKYKGSDNVMRNTRYNGNYSLAFTAGKEITTGSRFRNRIIGLNIKQPGVVAFVIRQLISKLLRHCRDRAQCMLMKRLTQFNIRDISEPISV